MFFNENMKTFKLSDPDLESEKFKIVYVGAIRQVNKLDILLDIAKKITSSDIHFLVYGTGDRVENLKLRIITEEIRNVTFKGQVEKNLYHLCFQKLI